MIKRLVPGLLLTLVLVTGCAAHSDHDGARLPAARPESLTAASGEAIHPGRISQTVLMQLHTDGRVSLQAELSGTDHFKEWMSDQAELLEVVMGGSLARALEGNQARFTRRIEYDSVAELNEAGMVQLELSSTPLIYGLTWKARTSSFSAESLAQVFTQPEAQPFSEEAWGTYLLDAYHIRYVVTDERTGAEYAWERSAREIGSGQTVSFVDKAWRPLAWVVLGLAGVLLAFVAWAGLFGERLWTARLQES